MFSCFKSLNKKFICSICSACLLCTTGISSLRAEGDPLTLGETTVESATVGTNAFLTNTLQDHMYSSRLLSIFSQKPFLYVDKDGNYKLTVEDIPNQSKIPFGTGTSTSVYIAAMPTDDISSDKSDDSSYDNLTWYFLDDLSWDKLCVRHSGTAKILYHVVSEDDNIKGTTTNNTMSSLKNLYTRVKTDILYDDKFNPNTQMLGFKYQYKDKDGKTANNTSRISMNPYNEENADFTIDKFLKNVSNGNFILTGEVRLYDGAGISLDENFEIEPTISSSLAILKELAEKNGNAEMLEYIDTLMKDESSQNISQHNSETDLPELYTITGSQITRFSDSTKEIRPHCPQTNSLYSVLVNNNWLPLNIDKESEFINNITSFVSEFAGSNDFDSDYSNKNLRGYNANGKGTEEYRVTPTLLNYCLAARLFANQNNKQDIVNAIDQLMSQYGISADKPNGTKP